MKNVDESTVKMVKKFIPKLLVFGFIGAIVYLAVNLTLIALIIKLLIG